MLHNTLLNRHQTPDNRSEFDMGLWSKVQMLHGMEWKGKGEALKVKGVCVCMCTSLYNVLVYVRMSPVCLTHFLPQLKTLPATGN